MLQRNKIVSDKVSVLVFIFMIYSLCLAKPGFSEIKLIDNETNSLTFLPFLRTDVSTLKNNIDLDSNNKDDASTYLGYDYSLGFDLKRKEQNQEFFLKLESNGPYDYNAPLFIHNTLYTSTGRVDRYRGEDLLPKIEEFWLDSPVYDLPFKIKGGLFAYETGHGFGLIGSYENYGVSIYNETERLKWRFYYSRPDLENKSYLGKRSDQDKQQGINYEHAKANFFALDSQISVNNNTLQPYVGVLLDNTNTKRVSVFAAPTSKDILGTYGANWALNLDKLSFSIEGAHNFGKAKSSDDTFKDVYHTGYAFYSDISYALDKFSPHSKVFYASGNKVTTDMVDNGDAVLNSGKNRAFSNYSPFNTTIADSHYPDYSMVPMVAMGNGYGLNYGVPRPGTFADPRLPENIILPNLGFDYALSEKNTFSLDWWYLMSQQNSIGTLNGSAKKLSRELGQEIDFSSIYTMNDKVSLTLAGGYFFPGDFYKEERDDTSGSLFSPFVRGDGKANGAYQLELSMEVKF